MDESAQNNDKHFLENTWDLVVDNRSNSSVVHRNIFCFRQMYVYEILLPAQGIQYSRLHAQSLHMCRTLWDTMDCGPPGSSVHGILLARILQRVAMSSSRGSSWPRDWTRVPCVFCTAGIFFTHWAIWEAHIRSGDRIKWHSDIFKYLNSLKKCKRSFTDFLNWELGAEMCQWTMSLLFSVASLLTWLFKGWEVV